MEENDKKQKLKPREPMIDLDAVTDELDRMEKEVMNLREINAIFDADYEILHRNLGENVEDFGFWVRTVIRGGFAHVEARMFIFRSNLLLWNDIHEYGLSPAEMTLLKDERYHLERGKVTAVAAKTGMKEMLLFVFKLISRISGIDVSIDTSSHEWQRFQRAIKVRDQLMHPKSAEELRVHEGDGDQIMDALDWMSSKFNDAGDAMKSLITEKS